MQDSQHHRITARDAGHRRVRTVTAWAAALGVAAAGLLTAVFAQTNAAASTASDSGTANSSTQSGNSADSGGSAQVQPPAQQPGYYQGTGGVDSGSGAT